MRPDIYDGELVDALKRECAELRRAWSEAVREMAGMAAELDALRCELDRAVFSISLARRTRDWDDLGVWD